ncbi:arginine-glutamic acid dipeptide repeats -like [Paramuricea clavata]|uniref:Arginine-glutamic acid dipeptide repeats -like n=1 Tax=Paramuricea clavata TaxID=317549 RepID=A0A7D9JK66_PARCT|nr:arginine-glutamic acid dipeptide repeats -like [Paramuricea clavata]
MSSRPHRRRRHNVLRRRNITRSTKTSSSEFVELSSCSEDDEYHSEDSDKDFSLYCCRHCYSGKSKSWHHGGYERLILCSPCLEYFKKYGVMRKIEGTRDPPPHMFKGMLGKENEVDYFINGKQLRSRRSTPNTSSSLRYGRTKACSPVDVAARDSPLPGRKLTRLSKPGSPSGASTGSNTSSSGSNKTTQANKRRRTKRTTDSAVENTLPPKRKKSVTRESDDELETDQSERNSSPMAEQEATPLEGDVTSLSSRTSTNEEACLSPSPESLDDPEREFKMGKFPARHVPDGRTSARTGLPFMAYKKPEAAAVNSKESGERILKDKKLQNEDLAMRAQRIQKQESKSSSECITSSSTMSQQEEHRKYMSRATRYPYPGIPGPHGAIMAHMPVSLHGDMPMLPWLRPGAMKDFESWYSPHKAASLTRGNPNLPPTILHSPTILDRNSPLHKDAGILLPAGHLPGVPPPVGTDPITGLHHSHSHFHTHYHVHPDNQPRSPSIGLEPNLLWRNPQHEMWLHPNAGIPTGHPHMGLPAGHPRHFFTPADDIASVSPYFHGLYPPSRELQLQHELMMSQGLKIEHGYPFYPPLFSREQIMRYARPQGSRIENELRRLETGDESSVSLLHRSDPRVMRNPALKNLENGVFRPSSKIHETTIIDLSKID